MRSTPAEVSTADRDESTTAADITHRRHAIIETVFADLIDGPIAHLPSGRFSANSAWAICGAITHNLLDAGGTLTSRPMPSLAVRPCAAKSSPCRHVWPDRNDVACCTCQRTGPTEEPHRGRTGQTSRATLPDPTDLRQTGSQHQLPPPSSGSRVGQGA